MSYLMSISIGPVQDFIATARRSRDLWFGSWLLSELSKAAASVIVNRHKKESLIFPFVSDPNELADENFNAPNKILAKVEKPEEIAREIESAIKNRLAEIRDEAFRKIKGRFQGDVAKQQIDEMTEFFWAAVPFEENDYAKARRRVEYLLAALKATRNFGKVTWGSNERKSALDGQRESVIPEEVYKNLSAQDLWKKYGIRENERLCGVGLLKRHGNRGSQDKFFSTSHIAALPLLKNLRDKNEVDKFIEQLKRLGISKDALQTTPREHPAFSYHDGHLLFIDRMRDYFDDDKKIEQAQAHLADFLKNAFNRNSPSPYYALLLADGDSMGKAIDAQMQEENPIEKHKAISQELSAFAKSVKQIVKNKEGSLIYAGGDDVLALMPLHTVLDCAKELSESFKEKLSPFQYEGNKSPTLSVGIAVAHHIEPLQDALDLARQAEKAAKSVEGKDALAVIVDKRSGAPRMVKGSWKSGFYERLKILAEWHKEDDIPDGAAYQLRDLANSLEVEKEKIDEETFDALEEIKRREAIRILRRKRAKQGQEAIDPKKVETLEKLLSAKNDENDGKKNSVRILADELIVAKIFADAMKQAEGKL
jgi:CRISPR-associated protein Cmr2